MPSLRDLQLGFAQAVLGRGDAGFDAHVLATPHPVPPPHAGEGSNAPSPLGGEGRDGVGLTGARRIQVYRNNTFASLTEALAAIHPVVQRLVGEGFFRYAAHEYIGRHPSTSGNLHDFGGELADFLAGFSAAAALPYLADVARLEWAWHQVFHEADPPPLDLAALAAVSPEHYGELQFSLHPASRLIASPYPVLRIWEVNQQGYAGEDTVDLAQGGVQLLVIRRGLEVLLEPLEPGEFALLQALTKGQSFGPACEAAFGAQSDIDLPACLQGHVLSGTVVGFSFRQRHINGGDSCPQLSQPHARPWS